MTNDETELDRETEELKDLSEALVGLEIGMAITEFKDTCYTIRVVRVDGKPCIVTQDFRKDRINVAVKGGARKGVISSIVSIG